MSRRQRPRTDSRYDEYINSEEWGRKRLVVLRSSNWKCQRCGGEAKEVHHKTYERFGHENIDDLQALCKGCHIIADEERRERNRWNARLIGWANKVYGQTWSQQYSQDTVEKEFILWLKKRGYKKK